MPIRYTDRQEHKGEHSIHHTTNIHLPFTRRTHFHFLVVARWFLLDCVLCCACHLCRRPSAGYISGCGAALPVGPSFVTPNNNCFENYLCYVWLSFRSKSQTSSSMSRVFAHLNVLPASTCVWCTCAVQRIRLYIVSCYNLPHPYICICLLFFLSVSMHALFSLSPSISFRPVWLDHPGTLPTWVMLCPVANSCRPFTHIYNYMYVHCIYIHIKAMYYYMLYIYHTTPRLVFMCMGSNGDGAK